MQSKNLLLLTVTYPYGNGETFIETEIEYLSSNFDTVTIVPLRPQKAQNIRSVPDNCHVVSSPKISAFNVFSGLKMMKYAILEEICRNRKTLLNPIRFIQMLLIATFAGVNYPFVKKRYEECRPSIIYSYWCNYAALIGIVVACDCIPVVCRAHGYDLYLYRRHLGYIPFQSFIVEHISNLFVISEDGKQYIKELYPLCDKTIVSRLGVKEYGKTPSSTDGVFRIVSCSSISPVKRVDSIARAISSLSINVEWTHFGDGVGIKEIERIAAKADRNIRINLLGHALNKDVLNYYNTHKVDLFINFSLSEGIPVSIMEAISFGIPVLATDVGGTSEIVPGKGCGYLLPCDSTEDMLACKILEIATAYQEREKAGRLLFNMFQQYYNADTNYANFCMHLRSLIR